MNKTLKDKLAKLSPEQLAAFLEQEAIINPEFMESVGRLADSESPTKILESIIDEIKSIGRAHQFIDWRESRHFAQSLARVIYNIETLLLPKNPKDALKAMDAFLKISPKVIERVDDSNGSIGDEFRYAVVVWGKVWNHIADFDGKTLAKAILSYFDSNDYGLYDDMISAAGDALKRHGLQELEQLVKAECTNEKSRFSIFQALHDIAILRQSPEEFLAAFKLTKRDMSVSDQLELAKLFLDTSRVNEAIQLLESIQSNYDEHKRIDLLIKAHEMKGDMAIVQRLRWDGFVKQHRKDLFKSYYDHLTTQQEKTKAIDTATDVALTWDTMGSISMLFELNQHEKAAYLLLQRYDALNGHQYYTLKDFAEEFTKAGFPLEAILIYRCLTEDILARAQSKYYHHAINYLEKEKQISIWGGLSEKVGIGAIY
jgi:hypothetical protein